MQVPTAPSPTAGKRRWMPLLKLGLSLGILFEIYRRMIARDGADEALARLGDLQVSWFALAVVMQLCAIGCGIVRWRKLLRGQSIDAPWAFLSSAWMIGRFWGAVTPGGLGLDASRYYETIKHTGKVARATALLGVEKVLGQLAFGAVVMAGSIFGLQFIGVKGVLIVNGAFVVLVAAGLTLIAKPTVFRVLARVLPAKVQHKLSTLIDAVCAYHGQVGMLLQAALLGMGVHAFNNFIYVCAARALGIELSVGAVFFASSLQIMATLLPASINGMGLREVAAVALYTSPSVGLSLTEAVLIPTVGFAAEMLVSACGAFFFVSRGPTYDPRIVVRDPEREASATATPAASPAAGPLSQPEPQGP
jgi:glycosyltransferase 2 family protein